jgi:hypothetical protein
LDESEEADPSGILFEKYGFFAALRMTLICHCEPSQKAWQSVSLFGTVKTVPYRERRKQYSQSIYLKLKPPPTPDFHFIVFARLFLFFRKR